MNILESNKLIAEFMGGKYKHNSIVELSDNHVWLPIHGICQYTSIELGSGKMLKYHTSWDWLIPVVKKCIEYAANNEAHDSSVDLENSLYTCDINKIYIECVDFIKWYNEKRD